MSASTAQPTQQTDPSKQAMTAVMHSFMGRAAIERCIRAHGSEPPEDRMERTRAHLEAHGATVTEQGGLLWPVPQSPSLGTLTRGWRREVSDRARVVVSQQEAAARTARRPG